MRRLGVFLGLLIVIVFFQTSIEVNASSSVTISFDLTFYHPLVTNEQTPATIDPIVATPGSTIELPIPVRPGWEFRGWGIQRDQTTYQDIPLENYVVPNENVTLVASFIVIPQNIIYNLNGGTFGTINPAETYVINNSRTLTIPSRAGFTFSGWFDNPTFTGTAFTQTQLGWSGDRNFYAKWTAQRYNINFSRVNDSNYTVVSQLAFYPDQEPPTLPLAIATNNRSFVGWYKDSSLTVGPITEVDFELFKQSNGSYNDITLYPKFSDESYTISFDTNYNGGSSIAPMNFYYPKQVTGELPTPVRPGYTFNGWYNNDGVEVTDTFFDGNILEKDLLNQTLTLVAKWSVKQYTITFDTSGGSEVAAITQDYNSVIIPPTPPTKDGAIFAGWSPALPNRMPAGNITVKAQWVLLKPGEQVIQLSMPVFGNHSAALTNFGRVFTWGNNSNGRLGDGTTTASTIPIDITGKFGNLGDDRIIQLSMGSNYSSALSESGQVFMWGNNDNGQLGVGTTTASTIPIDITEEFKLSGDDKIIQLSMGNQHSSALSQKGVVFTWGSNYSGKLGLGDIDSTFTMTPTPISFDDLTAYKIIQLSMGNEHSSALSQNGEVFTWGYNWNGQLGNGTTNASKIPINITEKFKLSDDDRIIQLSMGGAHSSALSKSGQVFMWGHGGQGRLGDDDINQRTTPIDITEEFKLSGDKIIQLSMGNAHSSALSQNGIVFTWGQNFSSQLGVGDGNTRTTPTAIRSFVLDEDDTIIQLLDEGDKIIQLSIGNSFSSALSQNGKVYTWGDNRNGQLGDGTTELSNIPKLVSLLSPLSITNVTTDPTAVEPIDVQPIQPQLFTITYQLNGGRAISSQQVTYLSELSLVTPIRPGYSFDGWYWDNQFSMRFAETVMPFGDIVIYAKWILEQQVTFVEITPIKVKTTNLEKSVKIDSLENIESLVIELEVNESTLDSDIKNEVNAKLILNDQKLVKTYDMALFKTISPVTGEISRTRISNEDILAPIKIYIPVPEGFDPIRLVVVFIDTQANVKYFDTTVEEVEEVLYLVFETDHFSTYAIIEVDDSFISEEITPPTNDNRSLLWLLIGLGLALILLSETKIEKRFIS